MKMCRKCGFQNADNNTFCINCGSELIAADTRYQNKSSGCFDSQNQQFYYQNKAYGFSVEQQRQDKVSLVFCILAYLCPLFGLIYFCVKGAKKPRCCRAVIIAALIGFIVYSILGFLFITLLPSIANSDSGFIKDMIESFLSWLTSLEEKFFYN